MFAIIAKKIVFGILIAFECEIWRTQFRIHFTENVPFTSIA